MLLLSLLNQVFSHAQHVGNFLFCGVTVRSPSNSALFIDEVDVANVLIGHVKPSPYSCQILQQQDIFILTNRVSLLHITSLWMRTIPFVLPEHFSEYLVRMRVESIAS